MDAIRKLSLFLIPALSGLGIVSPAYADLDFSGHFTGGGVSYAGGSAALQGSLTSGGTYAINGIPLGPVVFGDTPFATGQFLSSDAADWYFGPGGSIAISGDIRSFGGNVLIPSADLLTGTFLGTTTLTATPFGPDTAFSVYATIQANIDPDLLSFLGLPGGLYEGSLYAAIGVGLDTTPPGSIICGACGVDWVDIHLDPVPEPSSLLFLQTAVALCGLSIAARKAVSRARRRLSAALVHQDQ